MVAYLNQRLFRHFDLDIQFVLDFRTKGHAVLDFLDKVRNDDEFANIRSKRQYVYSALLSFLLLYTYKTLYCPFSYCIHIKHISSTLMCRVNIYISNRSFVVEIIFYHLLISNKE